MRFTGNNVWVERGLSTAGYRDLVLSVYLGAKSFENWEYLILYWTDGQTWYEPVTIDNHHPASDGQLHLIEVTLPAAAANNPAFGIARTGSVQFSVSYYIYHCLTVHPRRLTPRESLYDIRGNNGIGDFDKRSR